MMTRVFATLSFIAALAVPVFAQQRDGRDNPIAAARDLYASARYDEALAVLNTLRPADDGATDRKSIEQYRSLCLLALGRGSEAEAAIAAVVTADPLFQPTESDASPRVRAAFSDVRQRLLPEIASSRYATAKASFDRKEYTAAEQQFRQLMALLDNPQMGNRLGDLRVLGAGFLELSAKAAAPPPPPAPAPEPKKEEPVAALPPAAAQPPRPSAARIYVATDPGIVAPVPIRQELPRVQTQISSQARQKGLLELVIDEQGRVASLTLRTGVAPDVPSNPHGRRAGMEVQARDDERHPGQVPQARADRRRKIRPRSRARIPPRCNSWPGCMSRARPLAAVV